MSEEFKNLEEEKIRLLKWPEAIRQRYGMYLDAGAACVNNSLREIIDNSLDEVQFGADRILVSRNLGGYAMVWDNGRGIPVSFSDEKDEQGNPITQAKLSISSLHSGSKFAEKGKVSITVGQNGVGSAAVCALSDDYILLSRITPTNFDRSIPPVYQVWNENARKKDLFYIVWYKRGILYYEGAGKKKDIEKLIWGKKTDIEIPSGGSTIVLFRLDTSIFTKEELESMQVNIQNLQYFLLIQEKFYGKKKVVIDVEGSQLTGSGFSGFGYDLLKEIIPADTSSNQRIGLYISIGYDEELGPKQECGSVNSLTVDSGVHIQYVENAFAKALKENYGIKHRYTTTGLRLCVVALAPEVVFSSQTKEKLKSFTKVKEADFGALIKEFQKLFKKYPEYWDKYVEKLNYLADSMKSLSAVDKAQKMIDNSTGLGFYKSRSGLVEGFADATAKNRWDCELFLCFTGDTEILTCNDERIRFDSLVKRIEGGEEIYTFSCTSNGKIIPAKIIAAKQIKEASELCKITLDNGETFTCTPEHEMLLRDGSYKMAKNLVPEDSLMPCYITYSDNYDSKEKRRVVLDMCPGPKKYYRPDKFSLANGGKLRPVFHVMSEHSDAERDESAVGLTEKINKHHKDGDKLNDSPRNLLLCSSEKHFSFHAKDCSYAAHKKAHEDPELYKKIYIDNKRTESFKLNASIGHKNYFKSEEGSEMKNHLREESIKEWSSEKLRKWRSEETKKYAKEHPEWAKANSKKSKVSFWSNLEIPEIKKFLQKEHLEFNSYNFNLAVLLVKSNLVTNKPQGALKFAYWDTIVDYDSSILSDFTASDMNISPDFIRTRLILERLKKNNTSITVDNYNKEVIKVFESGSVVTQGKGYERAKKLFPDLLSRYSAEINNNHKIVSIEFINIENTPVYCLEVDTPEHNFPLAAGIFTKNCEGLSPAGSLKSGRRPVNGEMRVAVLPLKGKILNVSDASIDKALDNKEIKTIFTLLGVGIQENNVTSGCKTKEEAIEALKKYCRYGKICISCDADSDGSQITSLILYMFSKFARFLIDAGCVYISLSPLFEQDGKYYYPNDPIDRVTSLPIGLDPKKPFRRWKGVGSVAKELIYDSFFNPSTRRLIQVTPEGMDYAMKLTEDINARKALLRDVGILTNPYNFTDL